MLLLYALCCLPLLAHALTPAQIAQFTGGCSPSCEAQSPCGEVSMTAMTDFSTTEEDREILRLSTNGIPNHPSQTCNGNATTAKPKRIEFPDLTPNPSEQFGEGAAKYCTPNIVGYAKNGIPFYSGNNTDCKNGINPVEKIVKDGVEDLWAFDTCAGHASLGGVYHYHCNPRCLYSGAFDEFLGVAMDGYPIYGALVRALGGVATNAALDECHGGNWNDGLGYRYIVNNEYPYTVGCLRGELRHAVECGPEQDRGSLCLCSGGSYGSGYGGSYGGSGRSGRYKRGGGGRRHGGDSSEDVEAQLFRFTALPTPTAQILPDGQLSPVGRCLTENACSFETETVHFGGRWSHRWDHNHGGRDGSRRDNGNGNGNGQPDIDTVPVPPVPDNEVDIAIRRIQSMEPAMETVARNLEAQCNRWYGWIVWRNNNCQGRTSQNCNNADNYLRHITDMQNALRQLQGECESLGAMVQRAGRFVSVPDEIGALPDWCMSQVDDQTADGGRDRDGRRNGRRGRN